MKRIIKISLFVALLFFLTPKTALASDIYPDSSGIDYKVMRIQEKVSLFFKFNPSDKEKFYESLLDKRMRELEYVVNNDKLFYLETASQRYSATAGELSELIIKNGLKSNVQDVKEKFSKNIDLIKTLQSRFDVNRGEWRVLEYSVDSLKIYSDKISSF